MLKMQVTEFAIQKIKKAIDEKPQYFGIYLGVKPTGCSGFEYVIEFEKNDNDPLKEYITIDGVLLSYLKSNDYIFQSIVLDWKKEGLNEGFKIENPLEKSRCGCGQSFKI